MKKNITFILLLALLTSFLPQAFAEKDSGGGVNLALGKPVYGVSYDSTYDLAKATDGNYSTNAAPGGSYDFGKYNGGMVVDLEDIYLVSEVKVYTRSDLDAAWARTGLRVNAATKLDFSDDKDLGGMTETVDFKAACTIKLKEPVKARYIRCAGISAVAEIEVYGEPYVEGGVKEFLDAESDAQYNATNLIDELSVMSSASDSKFGVDFLLTREESAKIICSLFGNGEIFGNYNGEFSDVSSDNEYATYIAACLNKGIISKSDTFRPKEYITMPEFAKMLLCTNGYYSVVSPDTRYPAGVMSDAADIKLFNGIENVNNAYLSKGDAAVMIYNMLMGSVFIPSSDTKESYLEYAFNKKLLRGVVTNNGITSLTEENGTVQKNLIEIANEQYNDLSGVASEFLGHNVYYIVSDEDDVTRIWTDKKKTNTQIIYDYEIDKADFDRIETKRDGKTKRYNLKAEPYTFFNGAAYHNLTETDLIPENGYLELVDNDNDGRYELLKVYKPDIFEVDSVEVVEANGNMSIAGTDGVIRKIDGSSKLSICNSKGSKLSSNNIYKGNVIYLYCSVGGVANEIEVLNNTASGEITQISDDSIFVDGEEYDKSEYFKNNYTNVTVGLKGQFVFDKNDRAVYIRDEKQQLSGQVLGVIVKAYGTENNDNVVIEAYTENKEFAELNFIDRPLIDGVRKPACDLLDNLGQDYFISKLALMSINSENKITSICTEGVGANNKMLEKSSISLSGLRRGAAGLYNSYEQIVVLDGNIPMFTVPVDDDGRPLRSDVYDLRYNCTDMVSEYRVRDEMSSDITLYGVDEDNKPSAAVQRKVLGKGQSHHGTISGPFSVSLMIYDGYISCVDSNNELYYKIKGTDIKTGNTVTLSIMPDITHAVNTYKIVKDNLTSWMTGVKLIDNQLVTDEYTIAIDKLKRGDVLRYSNGIYDSVSQLEVVSSSDAWGSENPYDDYRVVYAAGDSPTYVFATVKIQTSIVDKVEDGYLYFYYGTNKQAIKLSQFTGNIIVVGSNGIESYKATKASSYLEKGKHIAMYTNAGSDISIIMYND